MKLIEKVDYSESGPIFKGAFKRNVEKHYSLVTFIPLNVVLRFFVQCWNWLKYGYFNF